MKWYNFEAIFYNEMNENKNESFLHNERIMKEYKANWGYKI